MFGCCVWLSKTEVKLVILEGVDKDKCVINSALGLVCFVPIWTNWNGCLSVSALWLCPGCFVWLFVVLCCLLCGACCGITPALGLVVWFGFGLIVAWWLCKLLECWHCPLYICQWLSGCVGCWLFGLVLVWFGGVLEVTPRG